MTWRVHIEHDHRIDGIAVMIGRSYPDAGKTEVLTLTKTSDIQEQNVGWPQPSVTLEDSLGRALLDALAEHYGNTSGGRQQRADYEHERARVDRLIGALISTQTPAQPGDTTLQGVAA